MLGIAVATIVPSIEARAIVVIRKASTRPRREGVAASSARAAPDSGRVAPRGASALRRFVRASLLGTMRAKIRPHGRGEGRGLTPGRFDPGRPLLGRAAAHRRERQTARLGHPGGTEDEVAPEARDGV